MMNVGNPERAFDFSRLPNAGVGLARLEFIINNRYRHSPATRCLNSMTLPAELKARDRDAHRCLRGSCRVLCQPPGRGHCQYRRRVCTRSGDCAPVGFQVERIRQPAGRRSLRARGRKPDDRLPRYVTLPVGGFRGLFRAGMPRIEICPRHDGPDQRAGDDSLRTHTGTGARRG